MPKRLMVIAGEASGDLHGAAVVAELHQIDPQIELFGVGGDRMRQAGVDLLFHVDELAYIGFVEVVRHYGFFRRVFSRLREQLQARQPDGVILIDYPGFNLRFAKAAKNLGFRVFYYIAPQVWAWGQGRAHKMADSIDQLAVLFDFEVDFFSRYGLDTVFVGHPLVDQLRIPPREDFYRRFGLCPDQPLLALLPGSRNQEISHLLPPLLETAARLQARHPELQVAVALADTVTEERLRMISGKPIQATLIKSATYELLQHATAAIVASGTATLETACFLVPFILVYRVSPMTFWLGKRLVKIPHIGLVNVVAQEKIVDEFLQNDVHPDRLTEPTESLLFDEKRRAAMKAELNKVKNRLGQPGASRRTADHIWRIFYS
ncbi:MAG TPA: lipid-A-disaccharide synthase [bacterium]|nr:lipid-A-disaccharide synthase [bacterium]HNT64369.1 lipid-A-disaccharide synthase [bacterium]